MQLTIEETAAVHKNKKKVLVVDDGITMRMYYRDLLEKQASPSKKRQMASRGWRRCLEPATT